MREFFELPVELTIYSATETRAALLAWLERQDLNAGAQVEISGAGIEDVDGAGLQLLGALAQTLSQRGMAWRVSNPSRALLEACEVLGSSHWLSSDTATGVRT
jgi:ABC-type transporter Mla MlaB component